MDDAIALRLPQLQRSVNAYFSEFRQARRLQTSLLSRVEKKVLLWLAARTPAAVNSDHLTALGLLGMLGAGLCYLAAHGHSYLLLGACLGLAINWLGDSLDGTLARFRNRQRPRYGFYVDHVVDALCVLFLFGGLGLSGLMSWPIAIGLLVAYLMLMVETSLATYTMGTFQISFFSFSPTELRILLAIGNLAVLIRGPHSNLLHHRWLLFDVGGAIGMAGMLLIFLTAALKNGAQLYREENLADL